MSRRLGTLLVAALAFTSCCPLSAADLHMEFVEGLRKQGFGDMGIVYLRKLETDKKIPEAMVETFDLEIARCMQVAAQHTENVDEADRLRTDTRNQLDKFLKDHPTHAEAGFAYDTYGGLSLSIGNSSLKQALIQKDPKRKEQLLMQARTAFQESVPSFEQAVKLFKSRYDEVTKSLEVEGDSKNVKMRLSKKRKQEQLFAAEDDWLNARFNLAMVDYHVAQTYADPKHADVKPLLEKADKSLDAIWQGYRGLLPGLLAHYWTGRVNEQLGKFDKALDIYDEVTGNEPEEGKDVSEGLLNFFGENFLRRIQLLNQLNRRADLFVEAQDWLDANSQRKCDAYYGVIVAVARAYVAEAEGQPAEEKTKTMTKVVKGLRDIVKVNSAYQNEAILLYRLHAKAGGEAATEAQTFDEAVALGDAAMQNREPAAAVEAYERAMVLKEQEKKEDRLQSVEYHLALAKLQNNDALGAFTIADKFAREQASAKLAPTVSVLAINSALALCGSSQSGAAADRVAAEKQLNSIVEYTIQTWPNRAEADDARIALGRLKIAQGDLPASIVAFEKVNPASDRYAQSQSLSAQSHWRMYIAAKQSNKLDDAGKQHRTLAQGLFEQALAAASKSTNASDEAVVAECRLNLGEMHLEGAQPDKAVEMLTPLETKIRDTNPQSLDMTQLRTLVAVVRAHSATKNIAGAQASGMLLLQLGQDIPPVNAVLISVSRMLRDTHKADLARVIEVTNMNAGDQAAIAAAQAQSATSKQELLGFLTKLATRQQLGLPELIGVGDTAAEVGQTEIAKAIYQRVLETGSKATNKTPQIQTALIRVQSAQIGLLRADRQYEEAMKQVEALILTVPKALDPQIERAHILQGMAENAPEKWAAATAAWAKLRSAYQGTPKKPPVYYDIIYNTAICLKGQADNAADAKAGTEFKKQANQLLKGTLALAPALNGPDMVAKYTLLIDELKK